MRRSQQQKQQQKQQTPHSPAPDGRKDIPPPEYDAAPPGPLPGAAAQASASTSSPTTTHDWQTAVPDTSLFPAPPTYFGAHERSPTSNADAADAEAGDDWCARYPLAEPLSMAVAKRTKDVQLLVPFEFHGTIRRLAGGLCRVTTVVDSPDRCIVGYPPLYLARKRQEEGGKSTMTTIYYEARLLPGSRNNSLALGFTALPYPSFRMPGWHRGSLAVHGDDGRRYINDSYGGKDFTSAFRRGRTYGIGMRIDHVDPGASSVFFTCDGSLVGGWDLFEETDAVDDDSVVGLGGDHDVCAAVGTFDGLDFEVVLDEERWLYRME
ncbi:hypothetical protein CP533_0891 [Ophiocordyceps camponoti-saundersi (nom. inval.)]|nr:hypothetical protein CP533_0891 [Ophiocordyceps camponoti-saundersi (nom. inval.)]